MSLKPDKKAHNGVIKVDTAQKLKFSINISSVNVTKSAISAIWSHLLKKSLMESFIFRAV